MAAVIYFLFIMHTVSISCENIRVLSSEKQKTLPDKNGIAEVLNSSIYGIDEVTICARFKTYQFGIYLEYEFFPFQDILHYDNIGHLFSSFTFIPCEESKMHSGCSQNYKENYGPYWKHGSVVGLSRVNGEDATTQEILDGNVWSPDIWNSVCILASALKMQLKINLNGKIVKNTNNYLGLLKEYDQNLFLMNYNPYLDSPVHGEITDVNIWSRLLTESEVDMWFKCEDRVQAGKILDWATAKLIVSDLNDFNILKEETCMSTHQDDKIFATKLRLDYQNTIEFCQKLGSQIVVAKDIKTLQEMLQAANGTCGQQSRIYSGYSDRDEEGKWVDVMGNILSWNNWKSNSPVNWTHLDCASFSFDESQFSDGVCTTPNCPLCNFSHFSSFILRGVCLDSSVDKYYRIQTTERFIGLIETVLQFSPQMNRWQICQRTNESHVLAHMKVSGPNVYPIGVNSWYFLDTACTDPGKDFRSLKLTLDHPNEFCCDTGACINSELVCNRFADCEDETDEADCKLVQFLKYGNDSSRPPLSFHSNGSIKLENVNISFSVIDIHHIDERESTFELRFRVLLKWFDKDLTFEYLKENDEQNFLPEELINQIWSPSVEFDEKNMKTNVNTYTEQIFISRQSEPFYDAEVDTLNIKKLYKGSENRLNLLLEKRVTFECTFDQIRNYPFGQQKCSVVVYLKGTGSKLTNLVAESFEDKGSKVLGNFVVEKWEMDMENNEAHHPI